jgi:hypothetical protein
MPESFSSASDCEVKVVLVPEVMIEEFTSGFGHLQLCLMTYFPDAVLPL